jgi:hypothetical protein
VLDEDSDTGKNHGEVEVWDGLSIIPALAFGKT